MIKFFYILVAGNRPKLLSKSVIMKLQEAEYERGEYIIA
jgi:hypothetical protein